MKATILIDDAKLAQTAEEALMKALRPADIARFFGAAGAETVGLGSAESGITTSHKQKKPLPQRPTND